MRFRLGATLGRRRVRGQYQAFRVNIKKSVADFLVFVQGAELALGGLRIQQIHTDGDTFIIEENVIGTKNATL